jgi:hypothetical protein
MVADEAGLDLAGKLDVAGTDPVSVKPAAASAEGEILPSVCSIHSSLITGVDFLTKICMFKYFCAANPAAGLEARLAALRG